MTFSRSACGSNREYPDTHAFGATSVAFGSHVVRTNYMEDTGGRTGAVDVARQAG